MLNRGSVLGKRDQHGQEDNSSGEREGHLRRSGDFQASVTQLLKGHRGAPADLYIVELGTNCKSERQAETAIRIGSVAIGQWS